MKDRDFNSLFLIDLIERMYPNTNGFFLRTPFDSILGSRTTGSKAFSLQMKDGDYHLSWHRCWEQKLVKP